MLVLRKLINTASAAPRWSLVTSEGDAYEYNSIYTYIFIKLTLKRLSILL